MKEIIFPENVFDFQLLIRNDKSTDLYLLFNFQYFLRAKILCQKK